MPGVIARVAARPQSKTLRSFVHKKKAVARKFLFDRAGLWTVPGREAAAMQMKTATHIFFAVTMMAIGLIGLIGGGFAPIWRPVPEAAPARELLALLCTFVSLGCGVGLLVKRTSAWSALVLFFFLLVWAALFKFRFIILAPLEEGSYQSIGENLVWVAAAWVLYAELAKVRNFLSSDLGLRIAYLLYGLALIAFGFSHFVYLELTAPLVPKWLPGPVFWAYVTGGIYLATGLAIAAGVYARLAAVAAAVQITLISILVWVPMVLAGHLSPMHWQETIVSWALTAGAWVLATGSPPETVARLFPSPTRRSERSGIRR
jgi:uncharacterized membrane protein